MVRSGSFRRCRYQHSEVLYCFYFAQRSIPSIQNIFNTTVLDSSLMYYYSDRLRMMKLSSCCGKMGNLARSGLILARH